MHLIRAHFKERLAEDFMRGLLYPGHTKYAMGVFSFIFVFSVCLSVCLSVCQSVNIYFVSKISQELLYLKT